MKKDCEREGLLNGEDEHSYIKIYVYKEDEMGISFTVEIIRSQERMDLRALLQKAVSHALQEVA